MPYERDKIDILRQPFFITSGKVFSRQEEYLVGGFYETLARLIKEIFCFQGFLQIRRMERKVSEK